MIRCRRLVIAALAVPMLSPGLLAGVAGLAASSIVAAQPAKNAGEPLPIRAITLYRSGVGSFERRGLVDGDRTVQLRFATDQINDILKSMTILVDGEKGRVQSVSYASRDPLQKRLASFGIDLSDEPTLATIITRLRGAKARFTLADAVIEGTIVGGEVREVAQGNAQKTTPTPFANVLTSTGVRSVNLTTIASVDLLDAQLRDELGKALTALAEHRADRVKTVDVAFAGQGAFPAAIAYVHEMPMWKTSYRLVLPDAGAKGADAGSPTIQGWALVENTTDEDWEGVKLSLVAGRPVSFTMDLYEPLRVARPELPVPMVPGVMPRVYQGAEQFAEAKQLADQMRADGRAGVSGRPAATPMAAERSAKAGAFRDEIAYASVGESLASMTAPQAAAQAAEVGEVFQYQLKEPISIARQRSAMLPILASAIEGRRVSIYSRSDGSEHPMRGVEIRNSTGLQLMPGPISVFDSTAYAGDAQIGHVPSGDKRLLAYAVDLDVRALVKDESNSSLQTVRIVDGLLEQTFKEQATVTYAFSSKDAKRPRTILVEHPKLPGDWTLVDGMKPIEETQTLRRFEVAVEPAGKATLKIAAERVNASRIGLLDFDAGTLLALSKNGKVSAAVIDAFKKAASLRAAANSTKEKIAQLDQERGGIDQDQTRIRQNIASVGRETDLYRRYTAKLNEQETRLEQIREQRAAQQSQLEKQEEALREFLRGLNVE